MLAEASQRLRRGLRPLLLASFLGLAIGYAAFYSIFPLVSVPTDSEPNLLLVLLVLSAAAVLAGFETVEVPDGILQAFVAVPIGALTAVAIALSPVLTGFVEARADEIAGFTIVLGLPIFLLSLPVNLVGLLAGIWIRGFVMRRPSRLAVGIPRERK